MSTASIVAGAVGSIPANIAYSNSIKNNIKNNNSCYSGSWLEYDLLKIEIDKFSTIDEKISYLKGLKFFDFNLPNKESFNRAVNVMIDDLEYKREQEYYNDKRRNYKNNKNLHLVVIY